MTREEAIARIKEHKIVHKMNEPRAIYISEALDMAIKALESKDVLDKIRAEILQMPTISLNANDIYKCDILKIIDKYKAESEVNADADSD